MFVGEKLCNLSSKVSITIETSMVTRKMNAKPNQILKGITSHVTKNVINLQSASQVLSTMEPDKENLLVGTTVHGEDVIIMENMDTLE